MKKREKEIGRKFGFFIRCDDKNKPIEVLTDMYFELWETEKMNDILSLCETHNIKYDFWFRKFWYQNRCYWTICIVSINCKEIHKMEANTIYKGDCFELIKQITKADNVKLIITDPPYLHK